MNKLLLSLTFIAFILVLTACQLGVNQEGEFVTVYSERHYDTDRDIFDAFTKKTGIRVNVVRDGADQLITRLQNEGQDSPADLLIIADAGRLHRAKTLDLLQSIDSEVLTSTIPEQYRDENLTWFGLTKRARVFVYHPDRVDENQLSSYEALTEPKWQGRIVTRTSTNIYNQSLMAAFIELWGEEQAMSWAEGLVGNFARDPEGNDRDQAKAVVAGDADLAIMNTYYIGRMLNSADPFEREVAETVKIFFPNQDSTGTHVNISAGGVTKHSPNSEYAVKLLEYLIGEEAQRSFADANFEYPINPAVEPHALLKSWGAFKAQEISLSALGRHSARATTIMIQVGWK